MFMESRLGWQRGVTAASCSHLETGPLLVLSTARYHEPPLGYKHDLPE